MVAFVPPSGNEKPLGPWTTGSKMISGWVNGKIDTLHKTA